jgi:hypothetical protein
MHGLGLVTMESFADVLAMVLLWKYSQLCSVSQVLSCRSRRMEAVRREVKGAAIMDTLWSLLGEETLETEEVVHDELLLICASTLALLTHMSSRPGTRDPGQSRLRVACFQTGS